MSQSPRRSTVKFPRSLCINLDECSEFIRKQWLSGRRILTVRAQQPGIEEIQPVRALARRLVAQSPSCAVIVTAQEDAILQDAINVMVERDNGGALDEVDERGIIGIRRDVKSLP